MSQSTNDTNFERARDELFSHINRCGVLRATSEQQVEWMDDTMDYMAERFPELSQEQLEELRAIGMRFCQPVIGHSPAGGAQDEVEEEGKEKSAGAESAAA